MIKKHYIIQNKTSRNIRLSKTKHHPKHYPKQNIIENIINYIHHPKHYPKENIIQNFSENALSPPRQRRLLLIVPGRALSAIRFIVIQAEIPSTTSPVAIEFNDQSLISLNIACV
jgi:hypothetical protein